MDNHAFLTDHIPHRIRAAIPFLDMTASLLKVKVTITPDEDAVHWRCATDSIWEGRLAATRWLIEFIGIKAHRETGQPIRRKLKPKDYPADTGIEKILGGVCFTTDGPAAAHLAEVWRGCSQGGSHATHNSGHPPVNEEQLQKALTTILDHLQTTIYMNAGLELKDHVLMPPR